MSDRRIQTIDRVSDIFKCFDENTTELALGEISEETGINASTLHSLLASLKSNGFIEQDLASRKYSLGYHLLYLGNLVSSSLDIVKSASDALDALQQRFNETIHLATLNRDHIVYLDKRNSSKQLQLYTKIGIRVPAYATSTGKMMLSYKGTDYIIEHFPEKLKKLTENTITSRELLIEECKKIKLKGFAFDNEENLEGLSCISAPIFDYNNRVNFAISIAGPTQRIDSLKTEENINFIKAQTLSVSKKLGYFPK
ncbi:Transcriptional regulator, IclR family [Peptoniphilus sp. ING2-D1G]|nr:Transcriptional regulator, IclR family [Peptoniphilus sp. ING2-D1G]